MKTAIIFLAFCLLAGFVCFPFLKKKYNGDNISISVKETDTEYKFSAEFNESKSKKVQAYMDDFLDQHTFKNATIDAFITLDDRTKIYVIAHPGELKIVLNKRENSTAAYQKIKKMGEGIKEVLKN